MHIFAISLWSGEEETPTARAGAGAGLVVQAVRPTQKWFDVDEQIVEVAMNNPGVECVAGSGVTITIGGEGFVTTTPGKLKRLCPGDQKVVKMGVTGSSKGRVDAIVVMEGDMGRQEIEVPDIEIGLTGWTADLDNLARHEAPEWFDGAKFGIFIHWGVYAVTGWGNSTPHESYAEWFW